jgi:hypothetical protein
VNGTLVAQPARTTPRHTWQRRHQLARWVRPIQGDTSLVGRPPEAARQICQMSLYNARGAEDYPPQSRTPARRGPGPPAVGVAVV